MATDVKLIHADDWVAMYVDGKLKYQNHSIPDHLWHELLLKRKPIEDEDVWWDSGEVVEQLGGRYPELWAEVEEVLENPYVEDMSYFETIESAYDLIQYFRGDGPRPTDLGVLYERVKDALDDYQRELYKYA